MRPRRAGAGGSALAVLAALLAAAGPARAQPGRFSPIGSLTLLAGTAEGLWRSPDSGTTWQRVLAKGTPDPLEGLGAVHAILPIGPRVYVGGEGGLYLSEDYGETWRRLAFPAPVLSVITTRYHLVDPTIFVGTAQGLLRSPDGGRTVPPPLIDGTSVQRLEWPGPALIAATGRGVLVSEDAGAHFAPPGFGLPAGEVRALAPSSFYAVDPVLFAAVGSAGVFRSPDGGKTWTPTTLVKKAIADLAWLGQLLYAAGEGGVYRSGDVGRSWRALGGEIEGADVSRLLFPLAPDSSGQVFAATDRGVFRTLDGGEHWQAAGLEGMRVLTIATFPLPDTSSRKKPKR